MNLPAVAGSTGGTLMESRSSWYGGLNKKSAPAPMGHFHVHHSRESIDDSCTVVIGPSSGTLTFRRREGRVCSLILSRRPPVAHLSALSEFCPMARAKA